MQKKLIALAIAGLSTAAFAQTNVTIYGVADATFDNVRASGSTASDTLNFASRNRVTANSSYIGFKGTEDLGNGLKAVFQFENGLNTENGAAGVWNNRDSFVGLTGNFGTVVAGNLTGPARAMGAKMDVNSGATGIGANTALLSKVGGRWGGAGAGPIDQRINNAVAYVSPNFSGFSGSIAYSAGDTAAGLLTAREAVGNRAAQDVSTANTAWTAGLNYENGPFYAGYAYTKVQLLQADNDVSNHRLAGKWSPAWGSVGLMWDRTAQQQVAVGSAKQDVWYLPVTFKVTAAGTIIGQYGWAKDVKNVAGDQKSNHFALGYEHALSKRTVLKAVYSQINNNTGATNDFLYGVSAANSTATAAGVAGGANPRGFSFGVRHSF